MDRQVAARRFRAMGTDGHVIVTGPGAEALAEAAVVHVGELERRWSRFRVDSEVSCLNRSGSATAVSADTALLVRRAIQAWHLTRGVFDPTMLDALVELGYDRPFDHFEPSSAAMPEPRPAVGPAGIEVDGRRIHLPPGVSFDPGGIGKGLAADLVTERLLDSGAAGAMVNLGGDLRVRGDAPEGDRWVVTVREPAWSDDPIAVVELTDGAVATSTTLRRRWAGPDGGRHHLLDPADGRPHRAGAVVATAIAAEGWWAEAAATASIGRRFVDGVPLLRIDDRGATARLGGFEHYERRSRPGGHEDSVRGAAGALA